MVSFIQVRIETQRAAILLNDLVVGKMLGRGPEQTALSKVGFGQIRVEVQCSFNCYKRLLLQLLLIWREKEQSPNTCLGQLCVGRGEIWIARNCLVKLLDGSLIVRLLLAI